MSVFEYRIRWESQGRVTVGEWSDREITAWELRDWREDLPDAVVSAERREVLYGEPELYEPEPDEAAT